jgi:hypothetical protein
MPLAMRSAFLFVIGGAASAARQRAVAAVLLSVSTLASKSDIDDVQDVLDRPVAEAAG